MTCYLVRAGDSNQVKIGFAADVARRPTPRHRAHP